MNEYQRKLEPRDLAGTGAESALFSLSRVLPYVAVAILCMLLAGIIWHVGRIDITIPLGVNGDHNLSQELVTNFVRDGRYYVNPLLGAPGTQELYDFPFPHWTHFIILVGIRLFTRNSGLAINLLFFLGYPLAGMTALYAFRSLGISTGLAMAGAVLYAFVPFHQMRNEAHLIYACYYLVPLMALVVVWVSFGQAGLFQAATKGGSAPDRHFFRRGLLSVLVCVLIGWDNPYNAFFAVAFLSVAGTLGFLRRQDRRAILTAAVLAVVVVTSFGVGLLPNLIYIQRHGRIGTAQRLPVESEIYGLTLIQLLAPVTNHRVPALATWKEQFRSQALLVNENDGAALGAVGAAGFVALFLCFLLKPCPEELYSLSVLNLTAFLLGTIGGLGAVFSFVISPQLRGFNRISVYISFFCIAAALLVLDRFLGKTLGNKRWIVAGVVVPSFLLILGMYDQIPLGLMLGRDQVEKQYREDAEFVQRIEALVPPHSMIFQLPYDPFPESPPINQLGDYEELRGYLHSSSLRWSYGSMKGRETAGWLAAISNLPADQLLLAVTTSGFAGIVVDRFGFADHGVVVESRIKEFLGSEPIADKSGRLSFFQLDSKAIDSLRRTVDPELRTKLEAIVYPLVVETGAGCWGKEVAGSDNWHWCGRIGDIKILNSSPFEHTVTLKATFATTYPEYSRLVIEGPGLQQTLKVNNIGTAWRADVSLPPGMSRITLTSDANKVIAPGDPREMYFRINNFQVLEQSH
jgi:phosphoglycerol transferase